MRTKFLSYMIVVMLSYNFPTLLVAGWFDLTFKRQYVEQSRRLAASIESEKSDEVIVLDRAILSGIKLNRAAMLAIMLLSSVNGAAFTILLVCRLRQWTREGPSKIARE